MVVRIFLLFIIILSGIYIYVSSLNPLDVQFQYLKGKSLETSLSVLLISAFFLGAFLLSLAYLFKDLIQGWKNQRRRKDEEQLWRWFYQATDALYKDDLVKAERQIETYMNKRPDDPLAYMRLADIHHKAGRPSQAIEALQKAKRLKKEQLEILFKEAHIYKEMGNTAGAVEALRAILKINPSNIDAMTTLRDTYVQGKEWEAALELQPNIIKMTAESQLDAEKQRFHGYKYEYSRSLVDAGDTDKGVRELRDLIKEDGSFVPAHVLLGEVYQRENHTKEAIRAWRNGFESTHDPIFLTKLEDLYLAEEDPREIIRLYHEAMQKAPQNIVIPYFYAQLCVRLEMIDEARDRLLELEGALAHQPMYHFLLAEVYTHRQEFRKATEEYAKGLELIEGTVPVYRCTRCNETIKGWQPSCPECHMWGTLRLCQAELAPLPVSPAPAV